MTAHQTEHDVAALIGEVSHELRLPIANLKLLVETLLSGALEDRETLVHMLAKAKVEIERLEHLVANLLSADQAASSLQDCQWLHLSDQALYVQESLHARAQAKSIKIEVDIRAGWQIYANKDQLNQVLLNLVENAVKFTPPGGKVIIQSGDKEGSFSVTDSGIGMPESEVPKIFQRFYRIDRAKSRGSTGLGLSIVKHIVDLHGAKINVSSKVGSGSTFALTFPGPQG